MNILVSPKSTRYEGWLTVPSLENALTVTGKIDVVVYHRSKEQTNACLECLMKLKKNHPNCLVIYIRNSKDTDNAVKMLIIGEGGKYVDDEFYLESSEDLDSLVKSVDEVTDLVDMSGVNVVTDFFSRFLSDGADSSEFNKNYLNIVKSSVTAMVESYQEKNLELLNLAESASDVFKTSLDLITQARDKQIKLEQTVQELEKIKDSGLFAQHQVSAAHSTFIFPTITYIKEKKILRIRDIDSCQYLTSFCLGFRIYLEKILMLRPKLIFIEPVSKMRESKYKGYEWVTKDNKKSMVGYAPIVFTNSPTKDVIDRLLGDTDYDIFIVVDRGINLQNHILNCKGDKPLYAVNGETSIKTYRLPLNQCFSVCDDIDGTLFTVPDMAGYPKERSNREDAYLRVCERIYGMLYKDKKL